MTSEDLPPTQKGRKFELQALGLRDFAGLDRDDQRLDPFRLAKYANLFVPPFDDLRDSLSEETLKYLIGEGKDDWSGGACSVPLPDGRKLIILNPTHSKSRQNATLMEEISHVFLGHKPSRLAIKSKTRDGQIRARDYQEDVEVEAYGTGAAALVPYTALKRFVLEGKTSAEIARRFNVSRPLVEYRIKVSRLWDAYTTNVFSSADRG